jgi:hypothetical protein
LNARQEQGEQAEARDRTNAEDKEGRAPAVAPDEPADERDADERAARPRELDEADRKAAPLPADARADEGLHGRVEAALADPGQQESEQHRGVERQRRGCEHAGRERRETEQHHRPRAPTIGKRAKERAQEARPLVERDQRSHAGERHVEPARQGRRERVGEAPRRG